MEQRDILQAAWVLCSERGTSAQPEADALAACLAEVGAEPAARIWRDLARLVRDIQRCDGGRALQ